MSTDKKKEKKCAGPSLEQKDSRGQFNKASVAVTFALMNRRGEKK